MIFWSKKVLLKKKCWSKKNLARNIFNRKFGLTKFWGKKILVKKFSVKKNIS